MSRMKVTVVGYYNANISDYAGETDPKAMAAIDQGNVKDSPMEAICLTDSDLPTEITVEPCSSDAPPKERRDER